MTQRDTVHHVSRHFTLRLADTTHERLLRRARRTSQPPRALAQRYVEEGLRRDEHPLVHFVDGPAGRRPRLLSGPDVWEVVTGAQDHQGDVGATAASLSIPPHTVEAGLRYYAAYREEIDRWVDENDEAFAEGQAAWSAGRSALER